MDLILFQYFNALAGRWPWLDAAVIFSAEYLEYWLVAGLLALAVYFRKTYGWRMLFYSLGAAIFSRFFITEIIRFFYAKPRPFEILDVNQIVFHNGGGAFPSGHAAFFFALATAVFLYNKKWGSVFFIVAVLMTISRVISGIHWPADILGGAVVGILSGALIFFFKKYKM